MKCPKCNKTFGEGLKFCRFCGTPLVEEEQEVKQEEVVAYTEENPVVKPKKYRYLIPAGIAGMAVVVLVILVVLLNPSQARAGKLQDKLELGNKYLESEDYEQAKITFEEAMEIDEYAPDVYLGLSEAYEGLGESEKSLEALEQGIDRIREREIKPRDTDSAKEVFVKAKDQYIANGDQDKADELEEEIKDLDNKDQNKKPDKKPEPKPNPKPEEKPEKKPEDKPDSKEPTKEEITEANRKLYQDYVKESIGKTGNAMVQTVQALDVPSADAPEQMSLDNWNEKYDEKEYWTFYNGTAGIAYAHLNGDETEEMLVLTMKEEKAPSFKAELSVAVYTLAGEKVVPCKGDTAVIEISDLEAKEGQKNVLQCFLKKQEQETYICFVLHKSGKEGETEYQSTQFLIYGMEDGIIKRFCDVRETDGANVQEMVKKKVMDDVLKKEVEKDVLEDIAGTAKDVLYEKLEPYGFKCDWMDDYLAKKDEAAKIVFEKQISSMEKDITDLFKVMTEIGVSNEKMPGFSAWTAVYTDYTGFVKDYETMYGFKKAEGVPQVKEIEVQEETNPAQEEPNTEPVPNAPVDSQEEPAESVDGNDGIESENSTDTVDDTESTGNTDGTDTTGDVYFKDNIKIPDFIFKY